MVIRVVLSVLLLALLALLSLPACGDENSVRPMPEPTPDVAERAPDVPETSRTSLVGLWNDGFDGNPIMLDLRADGTAHMVSSYVSPATWTFDADSLRVTIAWRSRPDDPVETFDITYAPGEDVFKTHLDGPNGPQRVFRRASAAAVAQWSSTLERFKSEAGN